MQAIQTGRLQQHHPVAGSCHPRHGHVGGQLLQSGAKSESVVSLWGEGVAVTSSLRQEKAKWWIVRVQIRTTYTRARTHTHVCVCLHMVVLSHRWSA